MTNPVNCERRIRRSIPDRGLSDKAKVLLDPRALQLALQQGRGTSGQKHKSPLRAGFFTCYKFATATGWILAGQALRLSFRPLNYGVDLCPSMRQSVRDALNGYKLTAKDL